jgi:hypothetical protein
MNKAYERGFINKCAEVGVAPETLVKLFASHPHKLTRREVLRAILDYEGVKSDNDAKRYGFDSVNTVGDLKRIIKHKVTPGGKFDAEAIMGDPKSWAMQYYLKRRGDGKPVVALAGD